ncbi:hypothetical protein Esi_0028_0058 [Ectocarpus siliculosus]|uniref:Uncharacterized protein n=1 Tax=Ectocarpus siliculosus TaxID=2880 RepID=D8LK06_ECTSI|nr:hypothetical protein Esi_0028_0058 [Ectocarpus siliculosus]|eukprot:CBN74475.1 hypothetical protein Esi_0028_0058 [Ectocarpus siliculosus]
MEREDAWRQGTPSGKGKTTMVSNHVAHEGFASFDVEGVGIDGTAAGGMGGVRFGYRDCGPSLGFGQG